jgi:hypothetical protein
MSWHSRRLRLRYVIRRLQDLRRFSYGHFHTRSYKMPGIPGPYCYCRTIAEDRIFFNLCFLYVYIISSDLVVIAVRTKVDPVQVQKNIIFYMRRAADCLRSKPQSKK